MFIRIPKYSIFNENVCTRYLCLYLYIIIVFNGLITFTINLRSVLNESICRFECYVKLSAIKTRKRQLNQDRLINHAAAYKHKHSVSKTWSRNSTLLVFLISHDHVQHVRNERDNSGRGRDTILYFRQCIIDRRLLNLTDNLWNVYIIICLPSVVNKNESR